MEITAQDFEHLFDSAMEWHLNSWSEQTNRFDFDDMPKFGHIYWVEEYPNLILCREFLAKRGFTYTQSFDEATDQWAFITNYDFHAARVSA
jgi:hypothetical protein